MQQIPDHPAIRNAERTGHPDGKDPAYPVCPVCGEECERVYTNRYSDVVGCDVCLTDGDAWEEPQCFPERKENNV